MVRRVPDQPPRAHGACQDQARHPQSHHLLELARHADVAHSKRLLYFRPVRALVRRLPGIQLCVESPT